MTSAPGALLATRTSAIVPAPASIRIVTMTVKRMLPLRRGLASRAGGIGGRPGLIGRP
jgi:hypothetical protein